MGYVKNLSRKPNNIFQKWTWKQ